MVLTERQVGQYKGGTLSASMFVKMLGTVGFEDYLFRYCTIVEDVRSERSNTRTTTFEAHGYKVVVDMMNGECTGLRYSKNN